MRKNIFPENSKFIPIVLVMLGLLYGENLFAWCAGRVQGVVKNASTKEPIKGAYILIKNTTMWTRTSETGEYYVNEVPCTEGEYELVATLAGYRTNSQVLRIITGDNVTINFELVPTVIQSGDVINTNSKGIELWEYATVFTDVLTQSDFERSNIRTAGEAVRWLTGVDTRHSSYRSQRIGRIQGLQSEYSMILFDGQRMCGSYDLDQYPIGMIEKIEVSKNPYSGLYGEGAVTGIINIIPKNPENTNYGEAAMGTYNTKVHKLQQGIKGKNVGYIFNYNHRASDGITPEINKFDASDYRGKLTINLSPEEPKAMSELFVCPGYYYQKDACQGREHWRYNFNSVWDYRIHEFSELKTRFSTCRYIETYNDIKLDTTADTVFVDTTKSKEACKNIEGEIYYTRLILKDVNRDISHVSSIGYNFLLSGYNSSKNFENTENSIWCNLADTSNIIHSLFFQHEMQAPLLTILLSDRIDSYHKDVRLTPKISFLYGARTPFRGRITLGRSIREPGFDQLLRGEYFVPDDGGMYIRPNPKLTTERATTYEVGVEYINSKTATASISFFRHEIRNKIEFYTISDAGYPVKSYRNILRAEANGAEMEAVIQPADWVFGKIGYTFLNTKDEITGKPISGNSPRKSIMECYFKEPKLKFRINIQAEYVGPTDTTLSVKDYFANHMVNVKIRKNITKYAEAFIAANNIINKKYGGYDEITETEWLIGLSVTF